MVPNWRHGELRAALRALLVPGEDETDAFAREFVTRLGLRRGMATGSGRVALQLVLEASGARGREVILPTFGCAALVSSVRTVGALPVFADIDRHFNVTADTIAASISSRTAAVVVVHAGGRRADIGPIADLARDRFAVVEDCAQALGGQTNGMPWGTTGDWGIFSFGMGKNVMATAGGFLIGRSDVPMSSLRREPRTRSLARLLRVLFAFRWARYTRPFVIALRISRGTGPEDQDVPYERSALAAMDAAVLRRQMLSLDEIVAIRQRNARVLISALDGDPAISLPDAQDHLFTKFYVTLTRAKRRSGAERASEITVVVRGLLRAGYEPELVYTPLHRRFGTAGIEGAFPVAEDLWWRTIALPVRPGLSEEDCRRMAETLRSLVPR